MSGVKQVKGINAVLNRWAITNKKIGRRAARGLKAGGNFILRESQKIVPIETKELHDSGYVKNIGKRSGFGAIIEVGYLAPYAVIVHEDLTAAHGKDFNAKNSGKIAAAQSGTSTRQKQIWSPRRPREQAKFLETPVLQNRRIILRLIAREAHV